MAFSSILFPTIQKRRNSQRYEIIVEELTNSELEEFVFHLSEDESIMGGSNFGLKFEKGDDENRYSILGGKISKIHKSKRRQSHKNTRGLFSYS